MIDGKFIVHNDTYVQAIIDAAAGAEGQPSSLEEDFVANFPDPLQYLPPKSDEPTQREGTAYAPNPERQDMFEGYTFVFYDRRQYDNLLAPITQGRGKALCRDIEPEKTTVDEFVGYVKGVAGEKGLGEFEDGSEGKGVVVVRFNPTKAPGSEWYANFGRGVALHLDHRLIEQNEFLDAILSNDASVLRKPLELEVSGIIAPPPSAGDYLFTCLQTILTLSATMVISQTMRNSQTAPVSTPAEQSEMPPPETSRRGRSRRIGRTQFKGFDDDFSGPISFANTAPESMESDDAPPAEQPESQSLFVSQNASQEYSYEPSQSTQPPTRSSRKRQLSPVIIEEDEDLMETMAPAAARLKRQRLERGEGTPPPAVPVVLKKSQQKEISTKPAPLTTVKRVRKIKEQTPDLLEQSRLDREKAAEQAEAERLAIQEKYNGEDITAIRDLAIIEEMPVVRRPRTERAARADDSERWDDKWNGRKNFKKFRRRGTEGSVRGPERILVKLVEAKKRDFGVGDEYWGEDTSTKQRQMKKSKGKDSQMDTQTQDVSIVSQIKEKSTAVKGKGKSAQQPFLQLSDDEDSDSEIDFAGGGAAGQSQISVLTKEKLADKTRASQNKTLQASPLKRPAETPLAKEKPSKKSKPTPAQSRQQAKAVQPMIIEDSDDDSDDELKFRFKLK